MITPFACRSAGAKLTVRRVRRRAIRKLLLLPFLILCVATQRAPAQLGAMWTEVLHSNPWAPRYDYSTTVYKSLLWVIGGRDLPYEVPKDAWSSADGVHWIRTTNAGPWSDRGSKSAVAYGGELWLLGDGEVWHTNDVGTWVAATQSAP